MEAKPLQHVLNLLKDHRATTSAQRATSESTLVKLEELRATTMAHCTTSESQLVKLDGIIDLVNSAIKESPTDDEAFQEPPACYSRKPGAPPLEGAGRFYLVVHPFGGRENLAGLHGTLASYAQAVAQKDSLPYNPQKGMQWDCRVSKGDSFRVRNIGEGRAEWAKVHHVPMPRHNC
jgi:hypothetical protein